MNRLDQTFKKLNRENEKAFIAYITAGDPDLGTTRKLLDIFEDKGVDIVELGVPFSDPIGDGPVNQAAAERALEKGCTLQGVLEMVQDFRKKSELPIVLFSYLNPIHAYGLPKFPNAASHAGVDGVLAVDGPYDMCATLEMELKKSGVHMIYLVAPTTTPERLKKITSHSGGFVYVISSMGVTGIRNHFSINMKKYMRRVKQVTSKPVCIGFGIGDPQTARKLAPLADGIVVGSGFVKRIGMHGKNKKKLFTEIASYTQSMVKAVKFV